jgi:hypothetical protein
MESGAVPLQSDGILQAVARFPDAPPKGSQLWVIGTSAFFAWALVRLVHLGDIPRLSP